jgi:signal-transduction protein with cAMP-binding, CBS, and nucleotidyltransferase domain
MKLCKLLSEQKDKHLHSVDKNASIQEAAEKMSAEKTEVLLITDEKKGKNKYAGIISHSDIISAIASKNNISMLKVSEIMTSKIIVATDDDKVDGIMNIMIKHNIKHLPVVHEGEITCVISMTDIVKALYKEDETQIMYYGDYIGGTYGSKVF